MKFEILAVLMAMLFLGGCVRVDIGDRLPTLGEQIIDLYKAKEVGAISEAEFKRLLIELTSSLDS